MKKLTKLYALIVGLSAFTQSMGQDINNPYQLNNKKNLSQRQRKISNVNHLIEKNSYLTSARRKQSSI